MGIAVIKINNAIFINNIYYTTMKKIFMLLALISVTLPHIGAENKRKPLTAEQKAFIVSRFCSEIKYILCIMIN